MKKGVKLRELTPVVAEYGDASGFPDEQNAKPYCQEMYSWSSEWTVEQVRR